MILAEDAFRLLDHVGLRAVYCATSQVKSVGSGATWCVVLTGLLAGLSSQLLNEGGFKSDSRKPGYSRA
jgi:hypothetical protein